MGLGSLITCWRFSFDVHKLMFKVSIRSNVVELKCDEISSAGIMILWWGWGGAILIENSELCHLMAKLKKNIPL